MAELVFMNINHPKQASNPEARRLVRSYITRRQHEQKRSASVQATDLQRVRTPTQGRGDDVSESQYDCLSPLPSTRDVSPSASVSSYKAESTTTAENLAECEPDSPRTKLDGYLSKSYVATRTLVSGNRRDLRPSCYSLSRDLTGLPIYHEQRVWVPLESQSMRKRSIALGIRRRLEGEALPSWDGAVEEDAKRGSRHVYHLITKPKFGYSSRPANVTKHVPASRIHCSCDDLDEELRAFAGRMGISITAMLVCLRHSFTLAQHGY
jgi:hypothetical protein